MRDHKDPHAAGQLASVVHPTTGLPAIEEEDILSLPSSGMSQEPCRCSGPPMGIFTLGLAHSREMYDKFNVLRRTSQRASRRRRMVLLQRTRLGRGYWTAMIRIRAAQIQSAEHAGAACDAILAAKAVRSYPPHVSGKSQICDEGFSGMHAAASFKHRVHHQRPAAAVLSASDSVTNLS